jgi:flagellar hook-associated protein 2
MATSSVSSTSGTSTAADIQAANKAAAQRLLTSLSAGSGVDVASLAQNLVDAERIPKENAINAKISKNDNKNSGLAAVMVSGRPSHRGQRDTRALWSSG